MEEKDLKMFKFECGCRIWSSNPPIVEQIWLCQRHRYLWNVLREIAPETFKKLEPFG